jgi:hypothetical protein
MLARHDTFGPWAVQALGGNVEQLTQLVGLLRSLGVSSYSGPNPFEPTSQVSLSLGPEPSSMSTGRVEADPEPDTEALMFAASGAIPMSLEAMRRQIDGE